jgi:hypothetical protein
MAVDVAALIANLLPALNAATSGDLVYWTSDELYQWADEAAKRLALRAAVFVSVTTQTISSAEAPLAASAVAANAIAPILVAWNSVILRFATVGELEALDDGWEAATGTPKRWTLDRGLQQLRLYPAPAAAGALLTVALQCPADISASQASLIGPSPLAGYLAQSVLGQARGRVSDAAMPEIAAHCAQRAEMYIAICEHYWGAS